MTARPVHPSCDRGVKTALADSPGQGPPLMMLAQNHIQAQARQGVRWIPSAREMRHIDAEVLELVEPADVHLVESFILLSHVIA